MLARLVTVSDREEVVDDVPHVLFDCPAYAVPRTLPSLSL